MPRLIASRDLGEDFEPNRQQRRDYVRLNQTRANRLHLVGFGRVLRPRDRSYESWALQSGALAVRVSPRRERRRTMIAEARETRRLRRVMEGA